MANKNLDFYHYTECGLENVFIFNMPVIKDHSGERVYSIKNIQGLHNAIAEDILAQKRALWPKEIRFMRTLAGWTQEELARKIDKATLTIGRWERAEKRQEAAYDVLMRILFSEALGMNEATRQPVSEMLANYNALIVPSDIPENETADQAHQRISRGPEINIDGRDPENYEAVITAAVA